LQAHPNHLDHGLRPRTADHLCGPLLCHGENIVDILLVDCASPAQGVPRLELANRKEPQSWHAIRLPEQPRAVPFHSPTPGVIGTTETMVDSVYAQFLTCGISFAQRSRIGRISPSLACGPLWPRRAHENVHHVVNMNLGSSSGNTKARCLAKKHSQPLRN
jgi:hypothetical protein